MARRQLPSLNPTYDALCRARGSNPLQERADRIMNDWMRRLAPSSTALSVTARG